MKIKVKGGKVDKGEDVNIEEYRELEEEKGIKVREGMDNIEKVDYDFKDEKGKEIKRSNCFNMRIREEKKEKWDNYEMQKCDGGEKIIFRILWIERKEEKERMGFEMEKSMDKISLQMEKQMYCVGKNCRIQ